MVTIRNCISLFVLAVLCFAQTGLAQSGSSTTLVKTPSIAAPKPINLQLWSLLGEKSFSNEQGERSLQVVLALEPRFKLTMTDSLYFYLKPQFTFASSQIVQRFSDANFGNRVSLIGAYVNVSPFNFLDLRAGAIQQDHLDNQLIISGWRSFPGLMQILNLKFDKNELSFTTQQTVPTSEITATQTAATEPIPLFLSETLKFKAKMIKSFDFELFGTLYDFQDLPARAAWDSSIIGNLTNDFPTPNLAQFRYEFMGWFAGANGIIDLGKGLKIKGGATMIENMNAPRGTNQGQLVFVSTETTFSQRFSLEPRFEVFFNESDTVPAVYNSADYGHNNRQGWGLELLMNFKNPDFLIKANYVEADLINFDPNQTKQHFLGVKLETLYDLL